MEKNILEWLENTASLYPDKMAVYDDKNRLTFFELLNYAQIFGTAISEKISYCKKRPIAVFLPKEANTLSVYLGVIYSGNFYVPIDIEMPVSRLDLIMETLKPALIVTSAELLSNLSELKEEYNICDFHDMLLYEIDSGLIRNNFLRIINTDILYIIFTSGSTGTPKGVAITHRGVINYIDWVEKCFAFTVNDSIGNQAPFYFDNSILDIYSTMKMGATLYIIPVNLFAQPIKLLKYIRNNKISTIFWVPSALIIVSKLRAFKNVDLTDVLKRVLFCGEVMPNKHLNIWREYLPNIEYANLYGPTEITDACTYYIVDREFADCDPLPIGFPMDNTGILVLDEKDHLVEKPGKIGELCVRGTGISVGYYNDIEKTKKAFVQNPLNHAFEEKIYRTGDLVEYNEYGELVYLSRKDFQIKHLGHRIELGEIENAVSSLSGISRCCCLYDEKHGRITLFLDKDISKNELHSYLANMIPEYMIPGKVIYIQNLPLNANGKIDRVKLKEYL